MLEVAEIFRRHAAAYRAQYQLLPSQLRAMQDIVACRTAHFGGHLKQCDHCGGQVYAYHSCRNRHCPKCHGDQTERWLAPQQTRLVVTLFQVAAKVRCTTRLNILHCPQLTGQQLILGAIRRTMAAEDLRQLQHARPPGKKLRGLPSVG